MSSGKVLEICFIKRVQTLINVSECIQTYDIPTALEVFLCFETKRNDINSPRKHSRNARVISAEQLSTMSKNNLRGITLDIGPILGIHSLTLIISWNGIILSLMPCCKSLKKYKRVSAARHV